MPFSKQLALKLFLPLLILLAWHLAFPDNNKLLPNPISVAQAAVELLKDGSLLNDILASLKRVFLGFGAAALSGILLGFVLGLSRLTQLLIGPIFEFLRPIPPIAWIPLSVSLLGFGDLSACFIIFIGAFHPILTNTVLGIKETPLIYLETCHTLRIKGLKKLLKVTWPQALPSVFAGLKVGLGFGWMCVVASEMFAANSGLGYLIQLNRQLLRLDRVVVGMLAIGLIGVIMTMLMGKLERLLLPWRYRETKTPPSNFSEKIAEPQGNDAGAQLELSNLTFSYSPNTPILSNITFALAPGEILSLIGESGSGKTTLLRILAGLLPDNAQQAKLDGKPLNFAPENTTLVFQETSLFPWMTCLENIMFAIESKTQAKLTRDEIRQKALYYLNLMGLKEKAHNYPLQLSGGQKQRVALARALAYEPKLLLLDEPFSALDSQTKEKLQEELSAIIKKLGLTAVFVTHDIREAVYLANKVALMQNGTIALVQCLTQPTPRQDAYRYSQEFAKVRSLLFDALRMEHSNEE